MKKITYEQIKKVFEEKGCQLITTEIEFINNHLNSQSKYHIISSCGHETIDCSLKNFKYRNSGIICKTCLYNNLSNNLLNINNNSNKSITKKIEEIKNNNLNKSIKNNFNTENKAFDIIKYLISDHFEVNINGECVSADLCIKPKNQNKNLWFPLQLKSTEKPNKYNTLRFQLKNYNNMFFILICIKPLKIYLIDCNNNIIRDKTNIGIKLNSSLESEYKEFEVNKNNLNSKLIEYIKLYNHYLLSIEAIDIPITKKCILEKEFSKYRETIFPNIPFKQSINYIKTDFTILNYNIQEKTGTLVKNNRLVVFSLKHRKNGVKNVNYDINDNDYYWLNFPNKDKFILIPSIILYKNHYLLKNNEIYNNVVKTHLSINLSKIYTYNWLKPYIYEYKEETEKIILDLFNNLPPKEIVQEEKINIEELLQNNQIELDKYKDTLVSKTKVPDKLCVDCGIKIYKTSTRCNPCARKARSKK